MTWIRAGGPWWGEPPWRGALGPQASRRVLPRQARAWRTRTLLARAARWLRHPRRVLYVGRPGHDRRVVSEDGEGRRYLQFGWDSAYQSVVGPGAPLRLELEYLRLMVAGLAFVPEPRRLLVVGVGGGALPMFLRAVLPEAHVDAVDNDEEVLEVARDYFGFREDARLRAHVADGRAFIEAPGPSYDVVFLDAFGPKGTPSALATREFLLAARARLTPLGAVVANVHRTPNPLYPAMRETWRASFAQLHGLDARTTANRVFVGLPYARRVSRAELKSRAARLGRVARFDVRGLMSRRFEDRSVRRAAEALALTTRRG